MHQIFDVCLATRIHCAIVTRLPAKAAMTLKVIGHTQDLRTGTYVIYAQASINSYLDLVGSGFDEFEIQRRRVHHKAYERMKADIIDGTLLPPITLAVKKDHISRYLSNLSNEAELEKILSTPHQVNILDGLQRTHILSDIREQGHELRPNQTLLLEFWLESNVNNLIYRIIVLNSGQKPMSMRHQIELLFSATKESLREMIPNIEIFTERDEARRTRAEKFSLERLAISYYAYITKSTEINKENLIAQKILEDKILEEGEEALGEKFSKFVRYLGDFCRLDREVFRIYPSDTSTWFGSENFMIAFFAAVSSFSTDESKEGRVEEAINKLYNSLAAASAGEDILGYDQYMSVVQGFPSRKTNVGYATRRLLLNVFKEFFRERGDEEINSLWAAEAS